MQVVGPKPSKPKPREPRDKNPRPPAELSREAKKIWKDTHAEWELTDADRVTLRAALQAWDRNDRARRILEKEGDTVVNQKTGVVHAHPANAIAKAALAGFLAAWRELGLVEENGKQPIGRPPRQ